MLEAIVQSHESLSNFLNLFRDAFSNRPQYRHFQAFVLGLLIYLGSRNLAELSRAIADGKSACSLYRFMAQMEWDTEQVRQVRWEMLNRRTRRALAAAGRRDQPLPVFLAIDDSLVEKSGKCIQGADYHYSTVLGAQSGDTSGSRPSWWCWDRATPSVGASINARQGAKSWEFPSPLSQNWRERWCVLSNHCLAHRPMC